VTAVRIVLLLAGVAGAVFRPLRVPAFLAPVVCALIALVAGVTTPADAARALGPLWGALGFLLAAIPLAVLLERLGYFEQVASLFGSGRLLLPGLWVLAAGTVAVMNLDAAVVLLTPLYLRIARQHGRSERFLAFQPVILALLASSWLTVSNLTNLIAAARLGFGSLAVLEHLGLPSLAACVVGYAGYRFASHVADPALVHAGHGPGIASDGTRFDQERQPPPDRDRRVLAVGSVVVAALLVGFIAGPAVGLEPWEVALAVDAALAVATRRLPVSSIPLGTAFLAASLAVLAAAAAGGFHLAGVLSGTGPLAALRQAGVSAGLANVVNNLPALLVSLPYVSGAGGHATCAVWPVLLGVNIGPSLLVTGALASLLWIEAMRRLGAPVSPVRYLQVGVRVAIPAGLVALGVLLALAPALGCG
jgi:arsenical pump membrane protein